VDSDRLENTTPAYALLNLRSSYQWNNVRFDFGVNNVFDKFYYEPMGGLNIDQVLKDPMWDRTGAQSVPGLGRTVYGGVTVKF
jgi:iron complex outermembrane receptor protein